MRNHEKQNNCNKRSSETMDYDSDEETKSLIKNSPSSTLSGKIQSTKNGRSSTRDGNFRKPDKLNQQNKFSDKSEYNSWSGIIIVCLISSSVVIVGIYIQLTKSIGQNFLESTAARQDNGEILIIAENLDAGYLDNVINVMDKFQFKTTHVRQQQLDQLDQLENYRIIWAHDYPFGNLIKKLDPNQRLNHFPGTGFITNKIGLSTTPQLPNLLPAFKMPIDKERFLLYASQNPQTLWIQKSSSHRGISIRATKDVEMDKDQVLVQKYMENPLLIDGKKFDIGIYAVLTSVDPLRVYIYEAESLIRFCAQPYYDKLTDKFNQTDIDSFVVGDDYTPIWLMPSLLRYYIGTNLSMKQSLNSYLRTIEKDGNKIWNQIENVIMNVYKRKEHHLARLSSTFQQSNGYNSTSVDGALNQFFEMVRFDFIVDDELNVYLMEANMSPNLSSQHFPPNRLLYEQILISYFNLVGLNNNNLLFRPNILKSVPQPKKKYQSQNEISLPEGLHEFVQEKETSVFEDLCASDECHLQCGKPQCLVCYFCLSHADKLHIKRAIFEHHNKWNFKRLLPSTDDTNLDFQLTHPETKQSLIDSNYIHVHWFRGKCLQDVNWCSQQTVMTNSI